MANSKYTEEDKLKALGLIKAGYSLKDVSRELNIPYTLVRKWKPEVEALETKSDLIDILDTDKVILHEIAEGVKDKLGDLVEDGGELVDGVLEAVDKLGLLQTGLQVSATSALTKIDIMIATCKTTDDLGKLVDAITKLQTAFFAKGANVNVLNAFGGGQPSDTGISAFKSLQRSA